MINMRIKISHKEWQLIGQITGWNKIAQDQIETNETESPKTIRLIDRTKTPEFIRWFGNSKVVDQNGQPLRVYKAMYPFDDSGKLITKIKRNTPFPAFYKDEPGLQIAGVFGDMPTAESFSLLGRPAWPIYPVYLSLQKPYIVDAKGAKAGTIQFEQTGIEFRKAMRSGQYDGAIIKNTSDEGTIYFALFPNQIKSAIANKGTFNPESEELIE